MNENSPVFEMLLSTENGSNDNEQLPTLQLFQSIAKPKWYLLMVTVTVTPSHNLILRTDFLSLSLRPNQGTVLLLVLKCQANTAEFSAVIAAIIETVDRH